MLPSSRAITIALHRPASEQGRLPPAWADGPQPEGEFWYFTNEHGEQWIARRFVDEVRIAGSDVNWEELSIAADEAQHVATAMSASGRLAPGVCLIKGRIFAIAEALWVTTVLMAAFPQQMRGSQ